MFYIKSIAKFKFVFIVLSLEGVKCSIDGTFSQHGPNGTKPSGDPCNPLYWYPQNIPEYCNFKKMPTPPTDPGQEMLIPIPIPVPMPAPLPILPPPVVPPIMMPPHAIPPGPPIAVPYPIMPLPIPLPFGIPLAPTNPMVPVAGIPLPPPPVFQMPFPLQSGSPYPPPYPSPFPSPYPGPYVPPYPSPYPSQYQMPPRSGMGMVPGISGLISSDGGINIMPFSDAYSDMLENHKQKMVRKRLQKFLSDYERPPWKSRRNTRRQKGNEVIFQEKINENTID